MFTLLSPQTHIDGHTLPACLNGTKNQVHPISASRKWPSLAKTLGYASHKYTCDLSQKICNNDKTLNALFQMDVPMFAMASKITEIVLFIRQCVQDDGVHWQQIPTKSIYSNYVSKIRYLKNFLGLLIEYWLHLEPFFTRLTTILGATTQLLFNKGK